jgi:hypothetical protein
MSISPASVVATVNAAIGAASQRRQQMRFLVSLINDGTWMEQATPDEMKEMGTRMGQLMGELQDAGVLRDPGGALAAADTAMTLRYGTDGKPVVMDGPFAETKEQVAGYMVLECEDLDEAVGWVEKMPVRGGSVEVRPIQERG